MMIIRKLLVIIVIGVPIFVLCVQRCYCNDILSKFHQSDYKLRDLRVDIPYLNKNLMHNFHVIGYKYNRTTTAFNATLKPKVDFEDKLECLMQAYKRASNEYRLFPMRFQINACKVMQNNVLGMKNIANYGNYSLCNWRKDTLYYISKFPVDDSQLPPLIPTGEYKAQVDMLLGKNHLATINLYGEVYHSEIKNVHK